MRLLLVQFYKVIRHSILSHPRRIELEGFQIQAPGYSSAMFDQNTSLFKFDKVWGGLNGGIVMAAGRPLWSCTKLMLSERARECNEIATQLASSSWSGHLPLLFYFPHNQIALLAISMFQIHSCYPGSNCRYARPPSICIRTSSHQKRRNSFRARRI